jgi:hypothetical protein
VSEGQSFCFSYSRDELSGAEEQGFEHLEGLTGQSDADSLLAQFAVRRSTSKTPKRTTFVAWSS